MKYDNILQTIGHTPTVQLHHFDSGHANSLWVKLESFNPGGSVKDRPALNMIEDAEARGVLKPGDTLVEPTSGNTGIGLAMVAAVKGYPAIFVMSADMSNERKAILKAFGAELVLTPAEKGTVGAIEEARRLEKEEGYFLSASTITLPTRNHTTRQRGKLLEILAVIWVQSSAPRALAVPSAACRPSCGSPYPASGSLPQNQITLPSCRKASPANTALWAPHPGSSRTHWTQMPTMT